MKINCFKTNEKYPKITTYYFRMNNKNILLDYGVELGNKDLIDSLDIIFISHEHGDHVFGLLNEYKYLNEKVKIFMTNTCKEILMSRADDKLAEYLDNKVTTLCFDDPIITDGIEITLYQAGHTFGSACILLRGEFSLFYTGDMNYDTFDNLCTYNVPYDLEVDYLIIDGTTLFKNDEFKKTSLTHLAKDIETIKKYYINVKPEKAVFIGRYLCNKFQNIYYEPDLMDYLEILIKAGYEPFCNNKIQYDRHNACEKKEGIFISASVFDRYNKDFSISLHISVDDIKDFIYSFKRIGKVLVGHCYGVDKDDVYTILKEGSNEI